MEPITIVLAVAGLAVGFGGNVLITAKKQESAEETPRKRLIRKKRLVK